LRVIDWRPQRDSGGGLFRWIGSAAAGLWQGAIDDHMMLSSIDTVRSRLTLDGLVSVWQPHEK